MAEQPAEISSCLDETGKPVELLADRGLLGERFVAVHATHLEPHEASLLGETRSFVCLCPTTERDLGDGLFASARSLTRGSNLHWCGQPRSRRSPLKICARLNYLSDFEHLGVFVSLPMRRQPNGSGMLAPVRGRRLVVLPMMAGLSGCVVTLSIWLWWPTNICSTRWCLLQLASSMGLFSTEKSCARVMANRGSVRMCRWVRVPKRREESCKKRLNPL